MICAKKCVSFLLVIALVNSVNSLPIEDEIIVSTIIEKMDDAIVELTTEFPILIEIKEVDTTEAPAPAKEKIKALSFILDSLKVVNEKALSFVQTYITDLDIENGEKPVVSLDTPQTDIKKKTIKHPLLHHFLGSDSSDSLQTAFAKYKGALQNIATKVKTIPASIIKHFTGTGPLQDPVENVTSSQGDMSLKPEVQANPETPISETPVKVSVTEVNASNIEAKPEENSDTKPEEKPESEPAKVEARKLGNSDIVAWPNSDTKESREIVETVKSVVDATKRVNEDAFNLVQVYLSRLSDGVRGIDEISENERSLDSSADEVEQKVGQLSLEQINGDPQKLVDNQRNDTISSASDQNNTNYAQISSPLYNLTIQFFSFLNSIVPRRLGREIANRLKDGAEGIVRSFSTKQNDSQFNSYRPFG